VPVPKLFVLESRGRPDRGSRPELRHVIGAYHALADCDVIHYRHTLAGLWLLPQRSPAGGHDRARAPQRDLIALYSELAGKVPVLAISRPATAAPEVRDCARSSPRIDARNFEVGDGLGDDDRP